MLLVVVGKEEEENEETLHYLYLFVALWPSVPFAHSVS